MIRFRRVPGSWHHDDVAPPEWPEIWKDEAGNYRTALPNAEVRIAYVPRRPEREPGRRLVAPISVDCQAWRFDQEGAPVLMVAIAPRPHPTWRQRKGDIHKLVSWPLSPHPGASYGQTINDYFKRRLEALDGHDRLHWRTIIRRRSSSRDLARMLRDLPQIVDDLHMEEAL